ncbi:hypothetical protein D3874_13070 [Oleomonas cavernae]|uniref:Uncharacterized protein n=1 Tax=Oleomonas cavernae TaxID=2320859 RepID=A0A418WCT0_9PROT|nr:hypothetical protein [Oleomonas cavernae]RJF87841.1 hypothetical protein D3874_13070 [Oleomonas cavernae]
MSPITTERLAEVASLRMGKRAANTAREWCAMEAVAYVAGEPWSDSPACVCPTLASFGRAWNDALPDALRNALLLPLIPRFVGTAGTDGLTERRAMVAVDWLVRSYVPAALRRAGLIVEADRLAGLPEINRMAQVAAMRGVLLAVQAEAEAARTAAAQAAGEAGFGSPQDRAAAMAAWDLARDARDATGEAVWAADWIDAGDPASAAARPAFVKDPGGMLATDLRDLMIRMIEVEETA